MKIVLIVYKTVVVIKLTLIFVRITLISTVVLQTLARLSCNKSPGLYGLTAEHIKYADSQLLVLLSSLVSSILVHGYIPCVLYSGAWVYTESNH